LFATEDGVNLGTCRSWMGTSTRIQNIRHKGWRCLNASLARIQVRATSRVRLPQVFLLLERSLFVKSYETMSIEGGTTEIKPKSGFALFVLIPILFQVKCTFPEYKDCFVVSHVVALDGLRFKLPLPRRTYLRCVLLRGTRSVLLIRYECDIEGPEKFNLVDAKVYTYVHVKLL